MTTKSVYESLPAKALVIWEILALLIGAALILLILFIFAPYTVLWYCLLWFAGAVLVLACFLYLPLLYISEKYVLTEKHFILKRGVIFNKTHYLNRNNISFVSVYRNPLTPILNISSLMINAPGAWILIIFMNHQRSVEIAKELSSEHKFIEL